jgi:hypothetical protein
MKYLIMECHMAYAVVLDEDGRFLKAANMDYEVGQTVDTIMEIVEPGAAFSEADCQSDSFTIQYLRKRWKYSLPSEGPAAFPAG